MTPLESQPGCALLVCARVMRLEAACLPLKRLLRVFSAPHLLSTLSAPISLNLPNVTCCHESFRNPKRGVVTHIVLSVDFCASEMAHDNRSAWQQHRVFHLLLCVHFIYSGKVAGIPGRALDCSQGAWQGLCCSGYWSTLWPYYD